MAADDEPRGTLRPTPPHLLAVYALVALVVGWLVHSVTERRGTPPVITWTQPLLLLLVAVLVGAMAWGTWRTVQVHREHLSPQQGLTRLVLGRASAIVGAVMGGGYLGYALSWIGSADLLAPQRGWRSAAAALAGLLVVIVSLLLERACRVPRDGDET